MREGKEGVVVIEDVRAPVFRALLHFVYTDSLPEVCSRLLCKDARSSAVFTLTGTPVTKAHNSQRYTCMKITKAYIGRWMLAVEIIH